MKKTNSNKSFWHSNFRIEQPSDIPNPKSDIKHPLSIFRIFEVGFRRLSDIRHLTSEIAMILAFFTLFSTILSAQPILKTYPNTNGGTAIGEYNNGANYLINSCTGNKATYLWTDGQGNLLDAQSDFAGSCGQYRIDANTYIKADTVGTEPNRDVRFRKIARNGAVILEKIYPLSMDNFGQFVVPTSDGGFLIAGNTQVPNDSLYKIQLVKTDANGNQQWQKVVSQNLIYSDYRNSNGNFAKAKTIQIANVGQTSDGGYFFVYNHSDYASSTLRLSDVLVRLNSNGTYLWEISTAAGNAVGFIGKVIAAENGNLYVNRINGISSSIYGTQPFFNLLKLSPSGNTIWSYKKTVSVPFTFGAEVSSLKALTLTTDNKLLSVVQYVKLTQQGLIGVNEVDKINSATGIVTDSVTFIGSFNAAAIIETQDKSFVMTGQNNVNTTVFYKDKFLPPTTCPPQYNAYFIQTNNPACSLINFDSTGSSGSFKVYQRTNNPLDGYDVVGTYGSLANFKTYTLFLRGGTTTPPAGFPVQSCLNNPVSGNNLVYFTNVTGNITRTERGGCFCTPIVVANVVAQTGIGGHGINQPNFGILIKNLDGSDFAIRSVGNSTPNCNNCTNDNIAPTMVCPRDTTIALTPASSVIYSYPDLRNNPNISVSDNCSPYFSYYADKPHPMTLGVSTPITTVTYTAIDPNGNKSTCSYKINIRNLEVTPQYCASKGVAPWEYAISNVKLGTLNNTSDKFKDINTLGYSDYTNVSTTLTKGQTYPLSITPLLSWIGNLPNAYARVWIDFNQNKTFEANELVLEKKSDNLLTVNVLIPSTALLGTTRMRVSLKNGSYPTACETFDKGEVEDYTVQITEGGTILPDLAVANLSILTPTIQQGQAVQYKMDIRNLGGNAPPHGIVVVASTDTIIDASDINVQTIGNQGGLPAGYELLGFVFNTPLPNDFPVGQYYLIAKIGNPTSISESNGSNNVAVSSNKLTITPLNNSLPDLTLANFSPSTPSVSQGQNVNFTFDAKNIGTGNATANFTIKSYLSTDAIFDANDYQNGTILTGNYTAGSAITQIQGVLNVANTVSVGNYYLILKIDADNQITESNENNNVFVSQNIIAVTAVSTSNDIALTISATPSVYRHYTTQNFRITAKNSGTTAFSAVKIKFTRPNLTVNGGTKVALIGSFQDFCPGGIECSEWTIPTLAAGATATLDIPVFVLNPTGGITATATLLSSNPVDNNTANNTASVTVNSANAPIIQTPSQLAAFTKPTQLIPIIIQKIAPTITENYIVVELESIVHKTIDFEIINAFGTVVSMEKIVVAQGTNKFHFQVDNLPKGMYFIQTSVGKGRNVPMKFLKM